MVQATALLVVQGAQEHGEPNLGGLSSVGITDTTEFTASDDRSPPHLTLHELSDLPATGKEQEITSNGASSGDTEDRRLYKLISDQRSCEYASHVAGDKPRDLMHVSIQPRADGEVSERDFNDWYEEEHIPLHRYAPGWLRSSRWELIASSGENARKKPAKYLALHEFEDIRLVGSNQMFMASLGTDWREEVMANIDKSTQERRMWKLVKGAQDQPS